MARVANWAGMALLVAMLATTASASDMMRDRFEDRPEDRWRFFTDTVMGGVSTGELSFAQENGESHARMTGSVSTENRGGFIQFQRELDTSPPESASGVRLVVRGNAQPYFVHLRTSGTVLPWQYYQAEFEASGDWTELRLPFAAFEPSGRLLRSTPRPETLRSVGIVAYGRDHQAEIEVREVGFY